MNNGGSPTPILPCIPSDTDVPKVGQKGVAGPTCTAIVQDALHSSQKRDIERFNKLRKAYEEAGCRVINWSRRHHPHRRPANEARGCV